MSDTKDKDGDFLCERMKSKSPDTTPRRQLCPPQTAGWAQGQSLGQDSRMSGRGTVMGVADPQDSHHLQTREEGRGSKCVSPPACVQTGEDDACRPLSPSQPHGVLFPGVIAACALLPS